MRLLVQIQYACIYIYTFLKQKHFLVENKILLKFRSDCQNGLPNENCNVMYKENMIEFDWMMAGSG